MIIFIAAMLLAGLMFIVSLQPRSITNTTVCFMLLIVSIFYMLFIGHWLHD